MHSCINYYLYGNSEEQHPENIEVSVTDIIPSSAAEINFIKEQSLLLLFPQIYYRPQRSCGQGYVFTRVCDSVHRGDGLPQCMLGRKQPPQKKAPLRKEALPGRKHPLGRKQPPQEGSTPREGSTPPPGIRSMSGRHALYWNAFFFDI